MLVLATDVDAVYLGFGTPDERAIRRASPERLRAESFPGGSMGPKVDAVCRFVEATGNRGVIGALEDLDAIIDGTAGTEVSADGPDWELRG
jgi:carbamate kinase